MKAAEPIRDKRHIKAITDFYLGKGQMRNYALIVMGIHTALRISDLLRLRWEDVYDFTRKQWRQSIAVTERKTGKSKVVALHKTVLYALRLLMQHTSRLNRESFLFQSRRRDKQAISRVQAYRIIRDAAVSAAMEGVISCHSLRKTFGYHAWKEGVPLAVIMEIYNHSSFRVTRRYLGITQDDKNKAYLGLNVL